MLKNVSSAVAFFGQRDSSDLSTMMGIARKIERMFSNAVPGFWELSSCLSLFPVDYRIDWRVWDCISPSGSNFCTCKVFAARKTNKVQKNRNLDVIEPHTDSVQEYLDDEMNCARRT